VIVTGDWLNTERDASGGIVRLSISERDGKLWVRAHGARDWGQVAATPHGSLENPATPWAFSTSYDFGFLRTVLLGYYNSGVISLTTYNLFQDNSGRANYWAREFFHREDS
jgi:hypothetical protein